MGMLDVWVAKPGAACQVDDRDWEVRVEDAHGNAYQWAGNSYAALPAPQAHWAGTIPPGTYVVGARRPTAKQGEPNRADSAIVEVGCERVTCVRLYVHLRPRRQPDPHPDDQWEPPQRPPRRTNQSKRAQ
jgi:hypothetical protein